MYALAPPRLVGMVQQRRHDPGWGRWKPGNPYEIEFKEVDGWVRPDNIYFTAEFDVNEFTATYTMGAQISVFISPADATAAGAGWRFCWQRYLAYKRRSGIRPFSGVVRD